MKARDLINKIHSNTAAVLAPLSTSIGTVHVYVDKKDLEQELLYLSLGNMDVETGLSVEQSKGGLMTLVEHT